MNPQLIGVLQHGYSYNVTEGEQVRQELQAPNKYMREAANEILKLTDYNTKMLSNYNLLMQERDSLIKEVESLREQVKSLSTPKSGTSSDGKD